tara:strand:+ start:196 stop:1065 length:870 start_codon:yes stop_codon:yes gene_type:complete
MPELPEVEVVKKSLENEIINLTVKDVKIFDDKLRYKVKKRDINKIKGLKIIKINRRSKYLLFFFNKKIVMLAHLGMTGKFFVSKNNNEIHKTSFYYDIKKNNIKKHNRLVFHLNSKTKLIYNDVRKFGFIKLDKIETINKNIHLRNLGPEPLNQSFNYQYFKNYLKGKKRRIKDLMMDQKFVSGLGNIYVNEILFVSRVRPSRRINKIKDFEIKKIVKSTKNILKNAIILGGSSIKDFANSEGKSGSFQQKFNVYSKKGYKCSNPDCKSLIKKIILSNRASFFCSACQK